MKLSYFYVAADVPSGIIPESSVVIDVLRATTTIAWALENGADSVQVFADIDELNNEAKSFPQKDKILEESIANLSELFETYKRKTNRDLRQAKNDIKSIFDRIAELTFFDKRIPEKYLLDEEEVLENENNE